MESVFCGSENEGALSKKPFEGKKIYYSGSIRGVPEIESDFAWHLVRYMIEGGASVLSEHVSARTPEEREEIRARRTGREKQQMLADPKPWFFARRKDIEWVDEATHFIALVNGPSHGVGMELERAILKPARGLNPTPILCLIHESMLNKLSYMIRGVSKEECPLFNLKTYSSLNNAKDLVYDFLR